MGKRRRTWLLLVALIGVALAVYFEPTHCVRGWLWGEAFFEGRPTSFWRQDLENWQISRIDIQYGNKEPFTLILHERRVGWFERFRKKPWPIPKIEAEFVHDPAGHPLLTHGVAARGQFSASCSTTHRRGFARSRQLDWA